MAALVDLSIVYMRHSSDTETLLLDTPSYSYASLDCFCQAPKTVQVAVNFRIKPDDLQADFRYCLHN